MIIYRLSEVQVEVCVIKESHVMALTLFFKKRLNLKDKKGQGKTKYIKIKIVGICHFVLKSSNYVQSLKYLSQRILKWWSKQNYFYLNFTLSKEKGQGQIFINSAPQCIILGLCFKFKVLLSKYSQEMNEYGFFFSPKLTLKWKK